MSGEGMVALQRAGRRALVHLVKAGIEGLKAIEAFVDELAKLGEHPSEDGGRTERIELE